MGEGKSDKENIFLRKTKLTRDLNECDAFVRAERTYYRDVGNKAQKFFGAINRVGERHTHFLSMYSVIYDFI